ncbi:MAG TPA: methyltransferase domain-containing protein [Terriglobales bacterium]|nr:methyltransferase domain-containing protein [Terriglobales bacterium]
MTTIVETTLNAPAPESFDFSRTAAFMNKVVGDLSGAVISFMCTLGDRLGLFKKLADGPASSTELALRTGMNERYIREWLNSLTAAGYLHYDPSDKRFSLPPEHAPVLAQEGGLMFMGGVYQHLPGLFGPLEKLTEVFRNGGGIQPSTYGEDFRKGMERISGSWFENMLVQQWIPAMEGLQAKLKNGADVADIGCGSGLALITMARSFPKSRFVGYELFGPSVARATANAEAAGVADRVRFEQRDVVDGLSQQYDLITSFDVLHDIANPAAVLRGIQNALRSDGTYLLLEIRCSEHLEENRGPIAAILYGTSVCFCTPTSLAYGAEGLGTMGMPGAKVTQLCAEAGFSRVRQLPFENPFNVLYEIRP